MFAIDSTRQIIRLRITNAVVVIKTTEILL